MPELRVLAPGVVGGTQWSVAASGAEMARLRHVLSPLHIPVDVLVASEQHVREWGEVPGTVYHDAPTEGKVLYDAA